MRSIKEYSIYLLAKRDYGVKELERKLLLKGYELDEIKELLEYYLSISYLDDKKLIERLILYQISNNKSKKQIEVYLVNKGFDKNDVRNHLNTIEFEDLEIDMLEKHIKRYLKASKPIPKEKIMSRLLNKGFSYQSIKKITDKYFE
jgi:SOS response regulatory protein OraA/RecX